MKKLAVLGMGVCIALAFSSCKSSESAYKKAYEKAKQQELAEPQTTNVEEVAPIVSAPVQAKVVESASAGVRQEKVTVVSGTNGLKDYSVVCGSFGVKANAENLKSFLDNEGYNSLVVFNADAAMYRVVVSTFSDRASAANARDAFKAKYSNRKDFQGSWLLLRIN
ncbi:SPOR domain-containing protein [uncultured Bacteroides sp.]|uniref:SPOR domain-containing protein n=1 Tax=uncultured Bacteroides sp. TaxID=162156 RepID=UPI002615384C|nr:SPOR domain-containing protein [uncultured Bacteroides sp.]